MQDNTSSSGQAEGTILELMKYVLPRLMTDSTCPTWPPDLFAVVGTVFRRTGAYVYCVSTLEAGSAATCIDEHWAAEAYRVGSQWRRSLDGVPNSLRKVSGVEALRTVVPPEEVVKSWKDLLALTNVAMDSGSVSLELARELIRLNGFADQASVAIGMGSNSDTGFFNEAAEICLTRNSGMSLSREVSTTKARVLPKKHTPQQGLTLRSMTHHLALCMPWEVKAEWVSFDAPIEADLINLLLLPWPREVDATFFQLQDGQRVPGSGGHLHRQFRYVPKGPGADAFEQELRAAVTRALAKTSRLHAIVFPELALSCEEWNRATQVAEAFNLLLIAGVHDDRHERLNVPVNSCRVQFATRSAESEKSAPPDFSSLWFKKQAKHHRWCMDRNQVLQYDLGGQLPAGFRCWENSHIDSRSIFFATVGGWLTFSVLICEDLARQDPIADVMRSVGPNLVIALLMDGPQVAARWPARYAGVLADDPGTSVLSLTSLGMCLRSRKSGDPSAAPSRVVALWKDKIYGTREIALEPDKSGCVISLVCEIREEYTADGRSDHGATQVPVFAGITQL